MCDKILSMLSLRFAVKKLGVVEEEEEEDVAVAKQQGAIWDSTIYVEISAAHKKRTALRRTDRSNAI